MKTIFPRLHLSYPRWLILTLAVGTAAFGAPAPLEADPSHTAEIENLLTATFHADAPGAVVLIARHGTVTLRKAFGLADLELGVPMDAADVFPICSITKQFTAVAILQLVEAGKLKLTDELGQFVPDYPTGGEKVTVAQLLMHTAGIPSIEEQPEAHKTWREDLTPDQLLNFTRNKPLAFAPGSDWKYSNTGYYLLGRVIEKVSGQSYAEYITTHVFAPAGMSHSSYPEGNRLVPKRARGYSRSGKAWANASYLSMTQPYAAGGLLATVDDLWAWEQALQAGRLLSGALLQTAYEEGHLPDGRATRYGFGWEVSKLGNRAMIGHGGGMPGFSTFAARVPDADIYVAILSNTDAPPLSLRTLAVKLIDILLGETSGAPAPVALAPATVEEYPGTYRIAPGANFVVVAKDNVLYGQLGPGRRPLTAVGPDAFTAGDMRFTFARDAAQHIEKILVGTDGPGPEQIWRRLDEPAKTP